MLQREDLNKQLVDSILSMSPVEQEAYFSSLSEIQKEYVKNQLNLKARPYQKCEIDDTKASFSDWIITHFYVPELNGPMWLAPYQIEAIDKATSKDKDGFFNYSLIVWMDIKKSIKSCIAAAIALRMAFMNDWASIKVVANKAEQAASRSYYYITRSLKLNPITAAMIEDCSIKINNYTINFFFNNSTIKAIPLNPEGEAGGDDTAIIWTEAWAARSKAAQTMFTEMVIPPAKFGKGFKWLESYAGFVGDSPILEPLYQNNVKEEYRIPNTEMYSNQRTFALCNHTPKLPWQTKEYYQQQATELTESEFNRVHRNQWVSSQNSFIPYQWWESCKENLPELTPNEIMILGVDAAISGDCFAIVGVTKHPKDKNKLAVRTVKIWKPTNGQSIIFSHPDPKQNELLPDGYIINLCKKYKVKMIVYDPTQLYNLATDHNLARKSSFWKEFNQGKPRLESDSNLYHLIRENKISHPNFAELNEHIKNADCQSEDDSKMRIVKRSDSKKIDSVIALSMASFTAMKLNL